MKRLKGLTLSFGLAALVCLPGSALAQISYTFQTVNAPGAGFTQLLGINKFGTIAGYRGSGLPGHPNKGFTLVLPNTFTAENFLGFGPDPGHWHQQQQRCRHRRILHRRQRGQPRLPESGWHFQDR